MISDFTRTGPKTVAGVDLGGSHAACLILATEGRLVGHGTAGPANLVNVGRDQVRSALRQALEQAARDLPGGVRGIGRCVIGAAGAGEPNAAEDLGILAGEAGLTCPVSITHDAAIALAGALQLRPGIIVMAGTGSICFGMDAAGREARAGGWGPLLGDEGSGYHLGRLALKTVLRAMDGRERATALTGEIVRAFGLRDPTELPALAHEQSRLSPAVVASLAPLVLAAARAGDAGAARLVNESAAELALSVRAVAARLGDGTALPITYGGGLLTADDLLRAALEDALLSWDPRARLIEPAAPPVAGAALMALAAEGGSAALFRTESWPDEA